MHTTRTTSSIPSATTPAGPPPGVKISRSGNSVFWRDPSGRYWRQRGTQPPVLLPAKTKWARRVNGRPYRRKTKETWRKIEGDWWRIRGDSAYCPTSGLRAILTADGALELDADPLEQSDE